MKSVLEKYFNSSVSHTSPVIDEVERKVDYDEKGNEIVSFVPVDTKKIIASNGKVDVWKLDNLIKAGINPQSMSIHTGLVSRVEGASVVNDFEKVVDAFVNNKIEDTK